MTDDDKAELMDMIRTAAKDAVVEALSELQRRAVTELEGKIDAAANAQNQSRGRIVTNGNS